VIANLRQQQSPRAGSDCLAHYPLTLEFVAVFPLELCRILLQHRQQALGRHRLP